MATVSINAIVCFLSCLIASQCFCQSYLSDSFYYPSNDSVLWGSSVSARQITQAKIKKLTTKVLKWLPECQTCPRANNSGLGKIHVAIRTTYTFDSLGYPTDIFRKSGRKDQMYFKCRNFYNNNLQLTRADLYQYDSQKDSLTLRTSYLRHYKEKNLLDSVLVLLQNGTTLRKNKYKYHEGGNLGQIDYYIKVGEDLKLDARDKFLYDSSNNLLTKQSIPQPSAMPNEMEGLRTDFFYKTNGSDSLSYLILSSDTLRKLRHFDINAKRFGTIKSERDRENKWESELVNVTEVKKGKIYFRHFSYGSSRVVAYLLVCDLKTGLRLYQKTPFRYKRMRKCVFVKGVKFPKRPFSLGSSLRSNKVKYSYSKK